MSYQTTERHLTLILRVTRPPNWTGQCSLRHEHKPAVNIIASKQLKKGLKAFGVNLFRVRSI